jgi:hypothetical protein
VRGVSGERTRHVRGVSGERTRHARGVSGERKRHVRGCKWRVNEWILRPSPTQHTHTHTHTRTHTHTHTHTQQTSDIRCQRCSLLLDLQSVDHPPKMHNECRYLYSTSSRHGTRLRSQIMYIEYIEIASSTHEELRRRYGDMRCQGGLGHLVVFAAAP